MNNERTIENELKELSVMLSNIPKTNVYTAPVGYFENLAQQIIDIISGKESSYITKVTTPFSVPNGYFDNFASNILNKIKASSVSNEIEDELKTVAPLLNQIDKRPVFSVPENYFNNFSINRKEQAKVRSIGGYTKKLYKLAAAAVIAGVMITSAFLFFNKETNHPVVSNSYTPQQIKHLSNEEIMEFLKVNTSPSDIIANTGSEMQEEDIKSYLQEMSDQEIKQYLQENAEPGEIHSKEG